MSQHAAPVSSAAQSGGVENNEEVDDAATDTSTDLTKDPPSSNIGGLPIDHMLLVLSDSALPLGSFAFSSGLESFIAHRRPRVVDAQAVQKFLALSLTSVSGATLPYVLAAYRQPQDIIKQDNEFDASTLCPVTRRASIAQGRALMGVWERSLVGSVEQSAGNRESLQAISVFGGALRGSHSQGVCGLSRPNGHFPPLWGAVCRAASIPEARAAYIYLFKHAQSVLSAAVRASTMGPYQAQAILASKWLPEEIQRALTADWETPIEDAEQTVPILDLWITLHDKLYTKIFNS